MKVGAITKVLKHVRRAAEVGDASPVHTLATHMRGQQCVAALEHGHAMAANARHRHTAVGYPGGGVVRAAGAEIGDAHSARWCGIAVLYVSCQALLHGAVALTQARAGRAKGLQPRHNNIRNGGGLQLYITGQQAIALQVVLAHQPRSLGFVDQ